MDSNTIFMWLVRGFGGLMNMIERMLADSAIPGDGPIQYVEDMHRRLTIVLAKMKELRDK